MHQGRPDGIPDWFFVPYHQDLCLICLFLWCCPGRSRVAFLECFPSQDYYEKHPFHVCLSTFLSTVLTAVDMTSHKGMHNNQGVPSECHHTSICDSKTDCGRLPSEEKVSLASATRANSSFPQIPQKEYLRSWGKSHWRAFSGLLRTGTIEGGSPLYFQSDQILQFLVCVLKSLTVTSNASIYTDQRHSHDKDSLSGLWPLRQAAKRVTPSLRDVLEVRALPCFQSTHITFGSYHG